MNVQAMVTVYVYIDKQCREIVKECLIDTIRLNLDRPAIFNIEEHIHTLPTAPNGKDDNKFMSFQQWPKRPMNVNRQAL